MSFVNIKLRDLNIAVIGLGLMGGSLALALRGRCNQIIGIDPDQEVVSYALEQGIVSNAFTHPEGVLERNDVVILAAPVMSIVKLIEYLPVLHTGEPIIIDLGSTKRVVVEAMNKLPARFAAVAGHPMCGKETTSIRFANSDLFMNAQFVLTPTKRTTERAEDLAEMLVRAIGARPVWIDADSHDRWVASISHIPYLASVALTNVAPIDALQLAGPGWQSVTRLSGSSVSMMMDIIRTNQDNILDWLKEMRLWMERCEQELIANNYDALERLLEEGREKYLRNVGDKPVN